MAILRSRIGRLAIVIFFLFLVACGTATVRIRRDLDTTGSQVQAFYISAGTSGEESSAKIIDSTGKELGDLSFENSGGSRTEKIERFNPATQNQQTIFRLTQQTGKEDFFGMRESNYIVQRIYTGAKSDLVIFKDEMTFTLSMVLNKLNSQDFKMGCFYYASVPAGEDVSDESALKLAKPAFAKLIYKSAFADQWNPYEVNLTGTACDQLPPNWAQVNEYYDTALPMFQGLVKNLAANNWQTVQPQYGKIYKMVDNPTNLSDIVGFKTGFNGSAWNSEGARFDYQVVPWYKIIYTENPEYGWPKFNSRNQTLEALVLQVKVNGVYQSRAVLFFVKSIWSDNGLYGLKILNPNETPDAVVKRVHDVIDAKIPYDIQKAYLNNDYEQTYAWAAKQPPFNLSQLGLDYCAVVMLEDTTETLTGTASTDKGTSQVTVQGSRRKKGSYYIYGNEKAMDHFATLMGESAMDITDLGYIQKDNGDGFGFIAGLTGLLKNYNQGQVTFDDVARVDQRSPESPTQVDASIQYFWGTK